MIPADFNPHRKLDGRAQAQSVLDETIEQSHRFVRIFDDRGEFYGFSRLSFAIALAAFLTRDKQAQAIIVLHDCDYVEKRCPRITEMLRRYGSQLKILKTDDSIRGFARGMVIGDHGVLMSRPHFDQPSTFVDYDEKAVATAQSLFAEIEQITKPGLSGQITGL